MNLNGECCDKVNWKQFVIFMYINDMASLYKHPINLSYLPMSIVSRAVKWIRYDRDTHAE